MLTHRQVRGCRLRRHRAWRGLGYASAGSGWLGEFACGEIRGRGTRRWGGRRASLRSAYLVAFPRAYGPSTGRLSHLVGLVFSRPYGPDCWQGFPGYARGVSVDDVTRNSGSRPSLRSGGGAGRGLRPSALTMCRGLLVSVTTPPLGPLPGPAGGALRGRIRLAAAGLAAHPPLVERGLRPPGDVPGPPVRPGPPPSLWRALTDAPHGGP